MSIRILLADDHTIVLQGLSRFLREQADMEVVGQAKDGLTTVELTRELSPDIVIMDISMPGLSGIEATRKIHGEKPDIRIIGLSMHAAKRYVQEMYKAGAAWLSPEGLRFRRTDRRDPHRRCRRDVLRRRVRRGSGRPNRPSATRRRNTHRPSGGGTSLFSSLRGTGARVSSLLSIPGYRCILCASATAWRPRGQRHRVGTAPHQSRDEENACAGQLHTRRRGQLSSLPPVLSSGWMADR